MKAMYPMFTILGAVLVLSSGAAMAQTLKKTDGVLADASGMTVYTFDKDQAGSGKSACNDGCAKLWPPVPVSGSSVTSPYSVVTRDDGSRQLAYKGKPLYLYAKDAKAGERKGDKVMDVWHVVSD